MNYNEDLVVEFSGNGGTSSRYDLNFVISKKFWMRGNLTKKYRKEEFKLVTDIDDNPQLLVWAENIVSFLYTYKAGGRGTVARSLYSFFSFQYKLIGKDYTFGTSDGLHEWCLQLMSNIRSLKLIGKTATANLSSVQLFLQRTGKLKSNFKFNFNTAPGNTSKNQVPTPSEIDKILIMLTKGYEVHANCLTHLLSKIENGKIPMEILFRDRQTFLESVKFSINHKEYHYDMEVSNVLKGFFNFAFLLFTYYTLGNKEQILNLQTSDFVLENSGKGVTDYILKGRAFKFIRLGIGESEFETDRAGYMWSKKFFNLRSRLLSLIYTGDLNSIPIFFTCNYKNSSLELIGFNPNYKYLYSACYWWKFYKDGQNWPLINAQIMRKLAEQIIDNKTGNPFLVMDKAQHDWNTYQKSYSKPNNNTAMENVSNAFNTLIEGGVESLTFEQRQEAAKTIDVKLVKSNEELISSLPHGLGCDSSVKPSAQEQTYLRNQKRYGRKPKVCADLLSCLECSKCAVIDDIERIYELFSFKESIELNKATYIGSNIAKNRYQKLILKIEQITPFLDPKLVARAKKRIVDNGVSEIWKI
tara:strand:- start:618 stop:2369 length:1752 start_codon:yes stop_codon:yes gene_type:complete